MARAERGARAPRSRLIVKITAGTLLAVLAAGILVGAYYWHEGYRVYAVRTGSMSPSLPAGDLLVDAPPSGSYQKGQVVTVRRQAGPDPVVTHRVFEIGPAGITTKGDANRAPDVGTVPVTEVVGEAVSHVPNGGYALVYFSHVSGVASVLTACLAVMFSWSMFFGAPPSPRGLVTTD